MGTNEGFTIRVRCVKCQTTLVVKIPRDGDIIMWPGAMYHVKCGMEVKVLSRAFKGMLEGKGLTT